MKRNKEEKHAESTKGEKKKEKKWEMKNWGKIFAGRKKKYAGRACPIEFFFF